MNHSPTQITVAPIHDETKTPTRNTKTKDVIKPSPAPQSENLQTLTHSIYKKSQVKSITQVTIWKEKRRIGLKRKH